MVHTLLKSRDTIIQQDSKAREYEMRDEQIIMGRALYSAKLQTLTVQSSLPETILSSPRARQLTAA